jgi:hypothetical protein
MVRIPAYTLSTRTCSRRPPVSLTRTLARTVVLAGWVTLSGRLFVSQLARVCFRRAILLLTDLLSQIPRVLQALSRHGIDVTYAREQHGNIGDAEDWKMTAFSTLVRLRHRSVYLTGPMSSMLTCTLA